MSSWAALATCTTVPVQVDPPRHLTGERFSPFCQVVVTKHYVSGSAGGAALLLGRQLFSLLRRPYRGAPHRALSPVAEGKELLAAARC